MNTQPNSGQIPQNSFEKNAEKELEESRQLLKKLEEISGIGHWEVDLETGINKWSVQFFRILGLDPGITPSADLGLSSIHPEDRPRASAAYHKSLDQGAPYRVEKRILRPSGEIRFVISEGLVDLNEEGVPVRLFGVIKDITEEIGAQNALLKKTRLIEATALIIQSLLELSDWQLLLGGALKLMGETVGADRTYFFENYKDPGSGKLFSQLKSEWSNGIFSSEIDNPIYQTVLLEENSDFLKAVDQKKPFEVFTSDCRSEKRAILGAQNSKSTLQIPLIVQNQFFGFIGFDDCTTGRIWNEDEKNFLKSITTNLSFAIERKQNLDKVQEALESRSSILERIGDAFFAMDKDWKVIYWNTRAEKILGIKKEDLVGFNLWEKFPEGKDLDFFKNYELAFKTQQPVSFEAYFQPLNQWYEANGYPSPEGISVFFRDITDKKLAEELIIQANDRFEKVTEATNDAIWDWDIANKTFFRSQGMEKFFGKSVQKFLPEGHFWADNFFPEDLKRIQQSVQVELENPSSTRWEQEYRILKEDGTLGYVADRGIIIRNEKGTAIRMVGAMTDISYRYEAQQQLIAANVRFEKATQATQDAIWDWNILENTLYWGDGFKTLFGYEVEKITPSLSSWTECIHPEDYPAVHQALLDMLENPLELNWQKEYRFKRADGIYSYVIDRGIAIRDSKGKAVQMVGAMTDISDRKRHEAELLLLNESLKKHANDLEISNKDLEQFAYVASHDLQEPLRMIISFLGLIEKKYNAILDEKGRQYILHAVDGARRMRQIILDLLEFSRVGNITEPKKWIQSRSLVEEVLLFNQKNIQDKKAKIHLGHLPEIFCHSSAVIQLFQNLISNSLKYQHHDAIPEVWIEGEDKGSFWEFRIKDNGIGIEMEYQTKIFIIFQRLHQKEQYSGSGIGLAICKKITEIHNGKIWVESSPQDGSIFSFTIKKQ